MQDIKTDILQEIVPILKRKISKRWTNLKSEINECIDKIKNFNESNDQPESLPQHFIIELLNIFNKELQQQSEDMKTRQALKTRDLLTLIYYDQKRYIDSFN